MTTHIVSVNVGPKYAMSCVTILHDMVARNASLADDLKHWCLTDRPDELHEGIEPIPANPTLPGWWQKVFLFSDAMPWAEGDRVAYFDLDVAITGRLEDLLQTPGIIRDPLWPCYNSSVMVWDHGQHREVWDKFDPTIMTAPGRVVPADCLPQGQINGGDQEWITEADGEASGAPWRLLPSPWCISYRQGAQAWPPQDCKVVVFNGEPKPTDIETGWVPDVYRVGGFTSLPVMDGVNVSYEHLLDNVRTNCERDLPWFGQAPVRETTAILVGGAPSMRSRVSLIRDHKKRGATIVTVNNAMSYLMKRGVTPDIHVMLDAREENAAFVADAPESVVYLIASQCHPAVFEALKGRTVIVWHNAFGDGSELREILDPWWEGDGAKPCILVPGGGTVGLRALWLIALQGYKRIHVYGMDSSYANGEHHAYAQALNDDEHTLDVALADPETGKTKHYQCALWMARQAEEFRWNRADIAARGVQIIVHGTGLIPDIDRHLRAQERAA